MKWQRDAKFLRLSCNGGSFSAGGRTWKREINFFNRIIYWAIS